MLDLLNALTRSRRLNKQGTFKIIFDVINDFTIHDSDIYIFHQLHESLPVGASVPVLGLSNKAVFEGKRNHCNEINE